MDINRRRYIYIHEHNVRVKDAVMSSAGVRFGGEERAWGETAHAYSAVRKSVCPREEWWGGSFFSLHLEGHILTTPKFPSTGGRSDGTRERSFTTSSNQRLRDLSAERARIYVYIYMHIGVP